MQLSVAIDIPNDGTIAKKRVDYANKNNERLFLNNRRSTTLRTMLSDVNVQAKENGGCLTVGQFMQIFSQKVQFVMNR